MLRLASLGLISQGLALLHRDVAASWLTWGMLQDRAFKNLFRSPNMLEDVALTTRALERGDLKLRVRALEAERALNRVQVRPASPPAAAAPRWSICCNISAVLWHDYLGTSHAARRRSWMVWAQTRSQGILKRSAGHLRACCSTALRLSEA